MTAPVVVVGDLMVDVVAAVSEPPARASDTDAHVTWGGGGGAANVAYGLARAGAPVILVVCVGDDVVGRAAVEELHAAGVDVAATYDPGAPTGTCVVVVEPGGERTMLPDRGANLALAPADLPAERFAAGAHLHLSGYVLLHERCRPAGLAALRLARDAGMTISVDPASAAPLRRVGPDAFAGWVDGVDVLLPNADEARVLGGADDAEAAGRALTRVAREVVVKLGPDGALWTDGERVVRAAAPPADVVDTTGAGDAFAAGWLAARRAGSAVDDALAAACRAGANAVARAGARG